MKLRNFKKKIEEGKLSPVFSTLGSSIIPATDDTVDLGSAAKQFNDLYVDGVAYIDLFGDSVTVSGSQDILPERDDAVDIGAAATQFKDLYIDGVAYIDQVRGELANIIPVTNSPVTQTGSIYVSGDGGYLFVRIAGAWKSGALT